MTGNPSAPDELDRLFAWLVRAIRDERPEYLAGTFSVAELLSFVPYKLVRADVGVGTNDDYGHAVTRLLAGERGFICVDELMQDNLLNELKAPVPDLQTYRSYLNTRVTLAQERLRDVLDALGPSAPREAVPGDAPPKDRAVMSATTTVASDVGPRPSRPGCRYCGQPLPHGREVRFCPHCGQDLSVNRCGACKAELEPGWKFCVACGWSRSA